MALDYLPWTIHLLFLKMLIDAKFLWIFIVTITGIKETDSDARPRWRRLQKLKDVEFHSRSKRQVPTAQQVPGQMPGQPQPGIMSGQPPAGGIPVTGAGGGIPSAGGLPTGASSPNMPPGIHIPATGPPGHPMGSPGTSPGMPGMPGSPQFMGPPGTGMTHEFSCFGRLPRLYQDPWHCTRYYWCNYNSPPVAFNCPQGQLFDQELQTCTAALMVECRDLPEPMDALDMPAGGIGYSPFNANSPYNPGMGMGMNGMNTAGAAGPIQPANAPPPPVGGVTGTSATQSIQPTSNALPPPIPMNAMNTAVTGGMNAGMNGGMNGMAMGAQGNMALQQQQQQQQQQLMQQQQTASLNLNQLTNSLISAHTQQNALTQNLLRSSQSSNALNQLQHHPNGLDTPACDGTKLGLFADPSKGCKSYYFCSPTGAKYEFTCPQHLLFSDRMKTCDQPMNVVCDTSAYAAALNNQVVNGFALGGQGPGMGMSGVMSMPGDAMQMRFMHHTSSANPNNFNMGNDGMYGQRPNYATGQGPQTMYPSPSHQVAPVYNPYLRSQPYQPYGQPYANQHPITHQYNSAPSQFSHHVAQRSSSNGGPPYGYPMHSVPPTYQTPDANYHPPPPPPPPPGSYYGRPEGPRASALPMAEPQMEGAPPAYPSHPTYYPSHPPSPYAAPAPSHHPMQGAPVVGQPRYPAGPAMMPFDPEAEFEAGREPAPPPAAPGPAASPAPAKAGRPAGLHSQPGSGSATAQPQSGPLILYTPEETPNTTDVTSDQGMTVTIRPLSPHVIIPIQNKGLLDASHSTSLPKITNSAVVINATRYVSPTQ